MMLFGVDLGSSNLTCNLPDQTYYRVRYGTVISIY